MCVLRGKRLIESSDGITFSPVRTNGQHYSQEYHVTVFSRCSNFNTAITRRRLVRCGVVRRGARNKEAPRALMSRLGIVMQRPQ